MRLHIMDDSKFDLGNFEEEYLTQAAGFVPFSEWTAQDIINFEEPDMVNSPAHYTSGRYEAIDVIEDAITEAPNVQAGFFHGQVLKYLLRLWHKIDAKEDAEKARWYLDRLIKSLE